jgi:hypothetical protein
MGDGERQHQPLNRQSERFVREGVDISLSTLADLIGHACVALAPIHALIGHHVLAGSRVHGPSHGLQANHCRAMDDTTVPLLARGGTKTARLWTYVRDGEPLRRHWFKPNGERRSTAAAHQARSSNSRVIAR